MGTHSLPHVAWLHHYQWQHWQGDSWGREGQQQARPSTSRGWQQGGGLSFSSGGQQGWELRFGSRGQR